MTQIEPISSERISKALRGLGISLRVDGDGDSVANFVKGNLGVFKLLFMATGQDCDILKIHGFFCTDSLGLDDLPQLIGICNQWHRGYLWPTTTATVHSSIAHLGADVNISLLAGVSDAELSVFLDTTISAFWQCREWLTQEVGSIHGDRYFSEQDRVDLQKLFVRHHEYLRGRRLPRRRLVQPKSLWGRTGSPVSTNTAFCPGYFWTVTKAWHTGRGARSARSAAQDSAVPPNLRMTPRRAIKHRPVPLAKSRRGRGCEMESAYRSGHRGDRRRSV